MIGAVLGFLKPVFGIIDKAVKDKDLAAKLKADLEQAALSNDKAFMEAAQAVIVAEAQGESAAQRNWRPHLMYFLMFLIAFNGVLVPLLMAFTSIEIPMLDAWASVPSQLWTLLTVGMGGYIASRGIEKSVKNWKDGGK